MILKRTTLLVALMAILFGGCTKRYETITPYMPPYHIEGISDVTLMQDGQQQGMFPNITYVNSKQERLTLSLEGVPSGISYAFSTPTGYPSFSTSIGFSDTAAAIGTYTVNLVATGDSSGRNVYPFLLTVKAVPECAPEWTGTYSSANNCATGTNFTELVTMVPGTTNRLTLNNFEGSGLPLNVDLSCNFHSIIIPVQTVGNYSVQGSGDFFTSSGTTKVLRIFYTKTSLITGNSFSCQESMSR